MHAIAVAIADAVLLLPSTSDAGTVFQPSRALMIFQREFFYCAVCST